MQREPAKHRTTFLVLATLLLIAAAAVALDLGQRTYEGFLAPGQVVTRVSPGSPADIAGLQTGDRLVTIDGIPAVDMRTLNRRPRKAIGETTRLEVDRAGERQVVELVSSGLPPRERATAWLGIVLGLCFAGCGLWAYLTAPGRSTAILATFCHFFGFSFIGPLYFQSFALRMSYGIVTMAMIVVGFALLLHYLLEFPRPHEKPTPLAIVYGPAAAVTLFFVALSVLQPDATDTLNRIIPLVVGVFIAGYFLTSLTVLLRRYLAASPADRHAHGLGLMLGGAVLGMLPEILAAIVLIVAPLTVLPGMDYYFFALVLIPITFAIAAVRSSRADSGPTRAGARDASALSSM